MEAFSGASNVHPIYVHKDVGSAYGATFPDFRGCFAASDNIYGLPPGGAEGG